MRRVPHAWRPTLGTNPVGRWRLQVRNAGIGALFGLGAAGLLASRLDARGAFAVFCLGACLGAGAALLLPSWPALAHRWAAALSAIAGLSMLRFPEPAFFLLVPMLAAALAWPLERTPGDSDRIPAWAPLALFAMAASVFFVQSANRHWQFASGSRDLGIFVQQHWLLAHGYVPFNTVMGMHMLADHMDWIDYLVAPLFRLGPGPETLLLVQSLVVASAVFPLFSLGQRLVGARAGLALAGAYLLAPDVHMGVMFDYNPSTLGCALLLWAACAMVLWGPVAAFACALLACSAKENFTLYVAMLGLSLPLLRLTSWRRGMGIAALALSLFTVQMRVLFPIFSETGFRHWEFEELGDTPKQIAAAAVLRPDRTAALLVDNAEKRRSLLLPLMNVGYVGAAEPASLLLLLPNWAERFLSTHRTRWWGYYYGMPAVAMACLGLLAGWRRLQQSGTASGRLPVYVVACALIAGLFPPYRTPNGNQRSDLYFLQQPNASAPEDVQTQRALVRYVGLDPRVRVAAQFNLLPHLAERPFIVMLDHTEEADVIALQLNGGTYPEGRPAWKRRLWDMDASGGYHVAFCEGHSVALRTGPGPGVPCPSWEALMRSRPTADRVGRQPHPQSASSTANDPMRVR